MTGRVGGPDKKKKISKQLGHKTGQKADEKRKTNLVGDAGLVSRQRRQDTKRSQRPAPPNQQGKS